jgi:hypothetical protein
LQIERFADSEAGAPEEQDQRPEPSTVCAIPNAAHHGDDLLDGRRVSRVVLALFRGGRPR